jgi:hypothetical protein
MGSPIKKIREADTIEASITSLGQPQLRTRDSEFAVKKRVIADYRDDHAVNEREQ